MYVYKSVAESRVANAHHIINSALTGSRSPARPRRRRKADARHRRASTFSGCSFSDDSAGSSRPCCGRGRKAPCFGVCAVVCDSLRRAGCVLPFVRESNRGPFVSEVEKRDEKRFGAAL